MQRTEEKPLLSVASGLKSSRYPVWFLRQAGRYLPEYMKLRSGREFTDLCFDPKLAAEVTLQPLRRYDLDAAIIFSDILIPCVAMGQSLSFDKGHGPILSNPVRDQRDLSALKGIECVRDLHFVGDAISLAKTALATHQTMIGFAGAPFTVASYMIEGSGSKNYTELKRLRFNHLEVFNALLKHICEVTIEYLSMQCAAGAEVLMLFDSWAGNLSAKDYRELIVPILSDLIKGVKAKTSAPIIYYPGQNIDLINELEGLPIDVIAIDWRARLDRTIRLLEAINLHCRIQGNLDPQTLLASKEDLQRATRAIVHEATGSKGHIFNVGHGLLPHTPVEAPQWVIDEIRNLESGSRG